MERSLLLGISDVPGVRGRQRSFWSLHSIVCWETGDKTQPKSLRKSVTADEFRLVFSLFWFKAGEALQKFVLCFRIWGWEEEEEVENGKSGRRGKSSAQIPQINCWISLCGVSLHGHN